MPDPVSCLPGSSTRARARSEPLYLFIALVVAAGCTGAGDDRVSLSRQPATCLTCGGDDDDGGGGGGGGDPIDPACNNDGLCGAGEDCTSCSADCGACPPPPAPVCGDAVCAFPETCSTCRQDCGACLGECGDGFCGPGETQDSCPADCSTLLGCFADASDRALPVSFGNGFTVDSCRAAARSAGYAFAGLQWYGECRAGNQIGYRPLADSACNTACNGNTWEGCGGSWAQRIFTTTCGDGACGMDEDDVTCPEDCAGLIGCYADASTRALPQFLGNYLTIESCRAAARAAGLPFAGLQDGTECWGGAGVGYAALPGTSCNKACAADAREGCGGAWANRIFASAACGDGACDATESPTTCPADCGPAGPVTAIDGKPQGLACGLGYQDLFCPFPGQCTETLLIDSVCEGVRTYYLAISGYFPGTETSSGPAQYTSVGPYIAPGYIVNDGEDTGQHENYGFFLQRRLADGSVTDVRQSDRFALPQGTVCGFHHTRAFGPEWSCMGLDPAIACPAGWSRRRHFDMSSGDKYWVWCEYQDPNHLCTSSECISAATTSGYTIGLSSNTDPAGWGSYAGHATKGPDCPSGLYHTPFIDLGRPEGDGMGYCR